MDKKNREIELERKKRDKKRKRERDKEKKDRSQRGKESVKAKELEKERDIKGKRQRFYCAEISAERSVGYMTYYVGYGIGTVMTVYGTKLS